METRIKLTAKDCYGKLIEYASACSNSGFVIDTENETAIKTIAQTFTDNKRGVLLLGNTGSGKTILFQMMRDILHPESPRKFLLKRVRDMVDMYNNWEEYGDKVFTMFNHMAVMFDDLGTEEKGNKFGLKIEVMEGLIQERYDLFKSKGVVTHFTTNLDYIAISQRYGSRCASRLNEMCEVVMMGVSADYKDRRSYRNDFRLPGVKHIIKPDPDFLKMKQKYKEYTVNHPQPTPRQTLGQIMKEKFGTESPL